MHGELIKLNNKKVFIYDDNLNYDGMSIPECGTNRYHIILDTTIIELNTVVHECFHVAFEILNTRGIAVNRENDEAMAYLLGYLVEEVMAIINNQNIKLNDGSSKKYKNY